MGRRSRALATGKLIERCWQTWALPSGDSRGPWSGWNRVSCELLRDPRGRWILEIMRKPRASCQIAGLIEGKLCEGVIDRTFIDEDGVRWIIDYKTSVHEGAGLENFLERRRNVIGNNWSAMRA